VSAFKQPAAVKKEEEAVQVVFLGRGRILVMDDEEVIRELLHDELTDVEYEVELTRDGAEAIEQYTKAKESGQPFDAVILDLTVPGGMGGREVIEKMSEFLTKPIVLASIALDTVYQVRIFHPTEKYNERRHHAIKRRTQISSLPGDRP